MGVGSCVVVVDSTIVVDWVVGVFVVVVVDTVAVEVVDGVVICDPVVVVDIPGCGVVRVVVAPR